MSDIQYLVSNAIGELIVEISAEFSVSEDTAQEIIKKAVNQLY